MSKLSAKFKVGDEVILRSGGPVMTITTVINTHSDSAINASARAFGAKTGDLLCIWFIGNNLKSQIFSSSVLKSYPSPSPDETE